MLMKMRFDVTYVDGRKVQVTSRPATEVAFERRFDRTVTSLFADFDVPKETPPEQLRVALGAFLGQLRSDYLYFLAWHSSKTDLPYDEWLELTDEISWDFVDTVDPTPPAVSAGG